jgi:hypothetical protein
MREFRFESALTVVESGHAFPNVYSSREIGRTGRRGNARWPNVRFGKRTLH